MLGTQEKVALLTPALRGSCTRLSREAATEGVITSALQGKCRQLGDVSKDGQHKAGQGANRAQSLCPPLTSVLWRAYGQNWNGGRSRCWGGKSYWAWGDRVVTTIVQMKKRLASCHAGAYAGFLRQSQARSPLSYSMPTPWLAGEF